MCSLKDRITINKSIVKIDGKHPGKLLSNFGRKVYDTKFGILKVDVYSHKDDWLYTQTYEEICKYPDISVKDSKYFPTLLEFQYEPICWALYKKVKYSRKKFKIPDNVQKRISKLAYKYDIYDLTLEDYNIYCHNVVFKTADEPVIIDFGA